ncbi:MAG TPA: peptidylprolyl isomerase [Mycobacterium sp.]|nr:peptidylprolyl isomerase [Mycobacterium sp.]
MPTNEERREEAKRKLELKLEQRERHAKRRRILILTGSAVAAIAAVGLVAGLLLSTKHKNEGSTVSQASDTSAAPTTTDTGPTVSPPADGKLPAFTPSANLGANCQYPAAEAAAKPVSVPRTGKVPTDPAQVSASMATTAGNIGLQLDNAKSPCTVNSFASLAQQGYFNDTPCHRLTTSPSLSVLQCGDPTGLGTGGPGYKFDNEYPTDQYPQYAPSAQQPVTYPRGTLAMANAGPGTNGSQFFLVYKDSQLPPQYTVFGTIDETGLATLDKIATAGIAGGGDDGKPTQEVRIKILGLD